MFFSEHGITESQSGRYAIFPHQIQNILRIFVSTSDSPTAPETAFRCTVNGTDLAPVIKILSVLLIKRKEYSIQFIKFKQSRQMVICFFLNDIHFSSLIYSRMPSAFVLRDARHAAHDIFFCASLQFCQRLYQMGD